MTTLFLCGDVMTGRGVDQILRHPSAPELYESYITDARDYVRLAERASGPVPRGVPPSYVWGDALAELERVAPAARIVNLETSVTTASEPWPKAINYRMHPANVGVLGAAAIDACVLANNHVMDWGVAGLLETLDRLHAAGIKTAGAGRTLAEAEAPARLGSLLVFGWGDESAGVPAVWSASAADPGVAPLPAPAALLDRVLAERRAGDLVVVSLHWGSNWGYDVPAEQVAYARALVDGGVDLVHGHSSHHPRPLEIYRNKLILYGCGDLLSDYEGIGGYARYRGELGLMYFPTLEAATGELVRLELAPMRLRKMRLERAGAAEAEWMAGTLAGISPSVEVEVEVVGEARLVVRPSSRPAG